MGFFLILIGALFLFTPNLVDDAANFFNDIEVVNVPNWNVMLPAPASVGAHVNVYRAAEQFSLVWGMFLAAMLVIRFAMSSPIRRKAENVSDIVFWLGAAYLVQTWLIENAKWFEFWTMILVLLGVTLIVRAAFLATALAARR